MDDNVNSLPNKWVCGGKRVNVIADPDGTETFYSCGKNNSIPESEGYWIEWVRLARNILASENTRLIAPEYFHPEFADPDWIVPDDAYPDWTIRDE